MGKLDLEKNMLKELLFSYYTAPEIALEKPITNKCDLFSFGIILFEILTETHPFGKILESDKELSPAPSPANKLDKPVKIDFIEKEQEKICVLMANDPNLRPKISQELENNIKESMTKEIQAFNNNNDNYKEIVDTIYNIYVTIMKRCWDEDPNIRPSFSDISKSILGVSKQFGVK